MVPRVYEFTAPGIVGGSSDFLTAFNVDDAVTCSAISPVISSCGPQ